MYRLLFCASLALLLQPALAQTGVVGMAPVQTEVRAADCASLFRTVDIYVDIEGLIGLGGDAGLNAFVLVFNTDRADLFQTAEAGSDLSMDWLFSASETPVVLATGSIRLVGVVADAAAPNTRYHVATLNLGGEVADVALNFNAALSSLGSRVVAGDGPGPIEILPPTDLTIPIASLAVLTGASRWGMLSTDYDLAAPTGPVDVRDLVALVNCLTTNN